MDYLYEKYCIHRQEVYVYVSIRFSSLVLGNVPMFFYTQVQLLFAC